MSVFAAELVICFNPRPAPRSGAMCTRSRATASTSGFNPRPAPRSGAISGDLSARRKRKSFNPRPAPRSGAISICGSATATLRFQSAPRSEERGDCAGAGVGRRGRVSIRAPLRGAGRWRPQGRTLGIRPCFNPRPAPRSGAITFLRSLRRPVWCFNPRPAPRSGAILFQEFFQRVGGVSIRAPLRGAGRFGAS